MNTEGRAGVNPLFRGHNELETGLTFETFQHAHFSKFASLMKSRIENPLLTT